MSNVVTDGVGSIGPDFVFHIPDTYPDHPISIGNTGIFLEKMYCNVRRFER